MKTPNKRKRELKRNMERNAKTAKTRAMQGKIITRQSGIPKKFRDNE